MENHSSKDSYPKKSSLPFLSVNSITNFKKDLTSRLDGHIVEVENCGIWWEMFEGRFEYTLDDKNRVSIPAKFREILAHHYDMNLILTNLDGCIVAYPKKEWETIKENISKLQAVKKEVRAFLRFYFSGVCECPIDRLGRILIPQSLRTYAKIVKEVVIIGMNKKIEIWSKEGWDEVVKEATSDPEKVMNIVSELGL